MEQFLREWRQDAFNKHQYESAIFVGDKLLALTDDDHDILWLAQVHFSTGNYTRAQGLLERTNLKDRHASCKYLLALCLVKQERYEDALHELGPNNPTHLTARAANTRRKVSHSETNGATKGRSAPKLNQRDRVLKSEEREKEDLQDIRYEASMCYLRGQCYAKSNTFEKAKECYKDAVRINVQCFEAFDQLMKNNLMSPQEEWAFMESLDFESIPNQKDQSTAQEAAHFTKMLYTTRLSKYKDPTAFSEAIDTLSSHYNLATNPDLLLSRADLLFTQCRFKDSLEITDSILSADKYNFKIYPLHLANLHALGEKNTLFLISHELADHHPEEPVTWLAVGVYYLTVDKIPEARRFFSKASMMDPHFGPAWIGFAHTFAAEGEHDQAISAYSTAAQLFQGTHLPQLFLGMQHLQLSNWILADEYLQGASALCQTDPLLLNELGVTYYHRGHFANAIPLFQDAIARADETGSDPRAWVSTHANLGHAYRRCNMFPEALAEFDDVIRTGGKDAQAFTSRALVLMEMGHTWEATVALHDALAVSPQDPVATDLLDRALREGMARGGVLGDLTMEHDEERDGEIEMVLNQRIASMPVAVTRVAKGKGKGKRVSILDRRVTVDESSLMEVSD